MNDDIQRKLRAGIDAARSGDRVSARRLLSEVTREDPRNELAWMWLASTVTSTNDRRLCLQRVLEINPNNTRAREALDRLGGAVPGDGARAQAGGFNPVNIAIGVIVAAAVIGAFALFSILTGDNGDSGGDDIPVAPLPTVTSIPRVPPTATLALATIDRTARAGALPPTWTPTPTPPPTDTPEPSATPYPLSEFVALVTSLEDGAAMPDLYRLPGEGGDLTLLGADFRDVAYDPSGQRIAFIRDFAYPVEGEAGAEGEATAEADGSAAVQTFPELWVADLDDLENPRKLTEMRANYTGSPTWSPEGREIVFVSDFDGDQDLWYVSAEGEALRKLTENEAVDRDPAWQPVLGSRTLLLASDIDTPGQTEIYSMELVEPGVEVVYDRLTNAANSSFAPQWSPNGMRFVFISDRDGDADVYLVALDGIGGTQRLTPDDADAEDRAPSFTPGGRWVAFISNRQDDRFQAYLVSLDGTVLTRLMDHPGNAQAITYRPELRLRLQG